MKSVKYIVLFLVIGLFLVGCESKKVSFDYDKAQKIIEKEITGLKKLDDDTLVDVYNLDLSVMDKHVFKQNTDGDFYAIIKTKVATKKLLVKIKIHKTGPETSKSHIGRTKLYIFLFI